LRFATDLNQSLARNAGDFLFSPEAGKESAILSERRLTFAELKDENKKSPSGVLRHRDWLKGLPRIYHINKRPKC
jgi:hypothetical protein